MTKKEVRWRMQQLELHPSDMQRLFQVPTPSAPTYKMWGSLKVSRENCTMRAEIIAYMIYSEGPEYPEYVMHFFLPKVFRDPQISEYVRQILSQSVLLNKQKIA